MRKALKIPNSKIKIKEASVSCLTHGSGPFMLPGSISSRDLDKTPLQRKMPVSSGRTRMLVRQNMRYPKPLKAAALTLRLRILPALVAMPGVASLPLL